MGFSTGTFGKPTEWGFTHVCTWFALFACAHSKSKDCQKSARCAHKAVALDFDNLRGCDVLLFLESKRCRIGQSLTYVRYARHLACDAHQIRRLTYANLQELLRNYADRCAILIRNQHLWCCPCIRNFTFCLILPLKPIEKGIVMLR